MNEYGKVIEPATIRFERLLPGPIERVWEYLIDSDKRGLWFASGRMEPRAGGKVAFSFDNASLSPDKTPPPEKYKGRGQLTTRHRIIRFVPPRFLSLTWGDERNPSEVSFELTAEGTGYVSFLHIAVCPIAHRWSVSGPGGIRISPC